MNITADKMFLDHITNMAEYSGLEKESIGGGRFVDKEGYGHELFNFKDENGKCYGYTTPWCKVNLEKISDTSINEDTFGKYIDNVLVVFTCENMNGKRVIAGFYTNARVYENPVDDKRISRRHNGEYVSYNLICNTENVLLISQSDRTFEIPHTRSKGKSGHGQSNIWYANKTIDEPIKNEIILYLNNIIEKNISDENRYKYYDENKKYVSKTQQITRSREARNKCIELKGCYCNICGFDFQKTYGDLGKNYIEVHHITSVANLVSMSNYEGTDPEKDLIPLCSNCHSMIHRKNPHYDPDDIKKILQNSPK